MLSVLRRGARIAALTGVLVLSLAACGAQRATTTEAEPTSTTSQGKGTNGQDMSSITLRRSGGIAGFRDELTVGSDGTTTLKSRGHEPFTCTVNPKMRSKIETASASADKAPAPRSKQGKKRLKTANPDTLYLTLTLGDQEVRFEDLGESDQAYREIFRLMNDVMTSAAAIRGGKTVAPDSACSK